MLKDWRTRIICYGKIIRATLRCVLDRLNQSNGQYEWVITTAPSAILSRMMPSFGLGSELTRTTTDFEYRHLFRDQFSQRSRVSHGRFAGEIFAYVRCGFAVNNRHRADGFVILAQIFLTVAAISQKQNCLRQKMTTHLGEQRFRSLRILLPSNHDLSRLA